MRDCRTKKGRCDWPQANNTLRQIEPIGYDGSLGLATRKSIESKKHFTPVQGLFNKTVSINMEGGSART